jgi:hypothetical protein
MHKLTLLVLIALVTLSSSVSMAKSRKTVHNPPHAFAAGLPLAPEAAAMRDAQRFWPNRPLCDDGGYRIRPCDMGEGSRGGK